MFPSRLSWRTLLLTAACFLVAPFAVALNSRSAVSVAGLDTNPCTVSLPCRSFSAAVTATTAGGEVIALSSGGYGAFTIAQSVTISGAQGVEASVTANSANGITVNAGATDRVQLRNLTLIGSGAAFGVIQFSGAALTVSDCLVRGFLADGIRVISSSGATVLIDRTTINENGGAGAFFVGDGAGVHFVRAVVANSSMASDGQGIHCDNSSTAVITRTTITGASDTGVLINAAVGLFADATLEGCTIAYNHIGVAAVGDGAANAAVVTLSDNMIALNGNSVIALGTGAARTFKNNQFPEGDSSFVVVMPAVAFR